MSQSQSVADSNRFYTPWLRNWWAWGGVVVLALLAGWILYSQFFGPPTAADLEAERIAFEDATGVHIVRVVLIMGGGLVGVHYEVLDPDRALILHSEETPPTLIVEKSGRTIPFEFRHHSQQPLETGRGYRLHFPNRGNAVHRGDLVTIQVGDVQLRHIVVQ